MIYKGAADLASGTMGQQHDFAVDCESGVSSLIRGPQGHPEDAVPDDGRVDQAASHQHDVIPAGLDRRLNYSALS